MSDYVVEIVDDPEAEAVIATDNYSIEILVKEATASPYTDSGVVVELFNSPSVNVEVDPQYEGLRVFFGPGPLPDPAEMPNTVYFVLPS